MAELINFIKGTSKRDKATYVVGKERVPASVITRLLTAVQDLSGAKLDRAFYQALAKYERVLDSLDALGVSPAEAVERFRDLQAANRPVKTEGARRATKVEKIGEAVAKVLCKRFKGSATEIVDEFMQIMRKPEFKTKVTECIGEYEKTHGKTALGYIKTSGRKGNEAAQQALAKARMEKNQHMSAGKARGHI